MLLLWVVISSSERVENDAPRRTRSYLSSSSSSPGGARPGHAQNGALVTPEPFGVDVQANDEHHCCKQHCDCHYHDLALHELAGCLLLLLRTIEVVVVVVAHRVAFLVAAAEECVSH